MRKYTPRRAGKRWLEGAPEYVLDCIYDRANTVHEYEGSDILRTDDYPQEFVAHLSQCLFGVDKAGALECEVL